MIEVIYKDEKQTAKGNEGIFNLPRNIRQIGLPGEEYRIYIEDYVYTFLKKIAEREEEDGGSVAVFTGETKWNSGTGYLFIKGVLLADVGEVAAEHVEFSDVTWQKIHEEIEQYFSGQEIMGWFLTQRSLLMEVTEGLQRLHMKLFGGEKVLMLMDPVEKEEAFFRYENGLMVRQSGYYIYYEKNPQMQAYMLEKNPQLHEVEQETVSDDAVRAFRRIIQKKHKEEPTETRETEDRTSVFSYAATACLVLAVMTVGVQFYQNYNQRNTTDVVNETTSQTVSSSEITRAPEKTKKVSVTPTSVLKKDPTPVPVSQQPTVSPGAAISSIPEKTTAASSTEQEIYREESDTRKAERRVKQEQAEDSADANKISEDAAGSTVDSAIGQGTTYVIKPGDTLYQISVSRYGTMEKVAEICQANGLNEDEIIYPGQIIVLP